MNTAFGLVHKHLTTGALLPLILPRQPLQLLLLSLLPFPSPKLPTLQTLMPRHPTPRAEQPVAPRALALRHLLPALVHHDLPAPGVGAPHPPRGRVDGRLRHRLLPPLHHPARQVGPQRVGPDGAAAARGGAGDGDDVVAELVLDVLRHAGRAEGVAAVEHARGGLLLGADFACV